MINPTHMPAGNASSELFLVKKATDEGERFAVRLKMGDQILGRSTDSDIFFSHDTISRMHARLSVAPTGVIVTDLKSRNGTWVNRKRIYCASVFPGEEIRFGTIPMTLSRDPSAESEDGKDLETQDARSLAAITPDPRIELTPAQTKVLSQLKLGLIERQVAEQLGLSVHTVHNHTKKIYRAYDVSSRVELLLKLLPR